MTKPQAIDVHFESLPESEYDRPLGETTGASVIFGTTGGVIEAAIRTTYEWLTGEELENVEFEQLRGSDGLRKATVKIGGQRCKNWHCQRTGKCP